MKRVLLCFGLCLGLWHLHGLSHAQDASAEGGSAIERARTHFKLGVDFYRERNFRAALIEFKKAYAAQPHYKLLYNLGQASLELQEDSTAIGYFSDYLREGGDEIDADRKTEVEQTIARLRMRIATVTVTTNQSGAEIYIDDTMVGTTPLAEPVQVTVGRRRVAASKPGYDTVEQIIDIAAGDHLNVDLKFKDHPVAVIARPVAPAPPPESRALSPAAWMGIATGVVGAGAVTFSILTALAQKSYDDEKKVATTAAQLSHLRSDAKTKALVADICWGATFASAVVTTVLLFSSGSAERDSSTDGHAAVHLDLGPDHVRVRGQF